MSWFLKSRGVKLERAIFDELMELLRLKEEKEFCDNLFFLFDEDKDNIIDFKEMVLGLKIFSNDIYFAKLACIAKYNLVFIDLCSDDNFINIKEFFRILKMNIHNRKDYKRICEICKFIIYYAYIYTA